MTSDFFIDDAGKLGDVRVCLGQAREVTTGSLPRDYSTSIPRESGIPNRFSSG